MKRIGFLLAILSLVACGNKADGPEIFLPRVVGPEGADLEALRSRYCQGVNVDLNNILTPENFRSIFNCANYDSSLEGLKPLFTSQEFPSFLQNLNLILTSDSTQNLKETLSPWLKEGPGGTSRVDRLLPVLAKIIKNPSFRTGLPLVNQLLEAGAGVWRELLPGLAELLYQERFPDTYQDLAYLFQEQGADNSEKDYATTAKQWANFLKSKVDGKSVASRGIELANRVSKIELRNTNIQEYLDHMNEKGVFVSLYLDSGAVRGEFLDPKLNADPDEEEIRDGLSFTPEERQERAYRKLFARGPNGEDAPIVQLAGMLEEFHREHPEFLNSMATWFAGNGQRVTSGLTEYVIRGQSLANLSRLSIDRFLNAYARELNISPQQKFTGPEFANFLRQAFASPSFATWVETEENSLNAEQFGARNGELMKASALVRQTIELYNLPALPAFGETIIPADKPQMLSAAMKRFSNLHRGDKLQVEFGGLTQGVESHLVDFWWSAAQSSLGESVVVDFSLRLVQSLLSEVASDFPAKKISLSEWYFGNAYGDPGTTELIAGYAFKELDLMPKFKKNQKWLTGEFANEVFTDENDKRAFRLLVNQVPNIWLYLRSGMSRSGNDLVRAMASKDRGYLIRGYVDLLASAQRTGWIKDAVRLVEAYHDDFAPTGPAPVVSDELEERRRVSKGADALKRVMRSLFEPETKGDYDQTTLGRLLKPISSLVSERRRSQTERFLLTSSDEVLKLSDADINRFLRELFSQSKEEGDLGNRRETLKAAAELLRDPVCPEVVRQLTQLFQEDAIKPALDFLAKKIDDGSLNEILLFIRRILGFRA